MMGYAFKVKGVENPTKWYDKVSNTTNDWREDSSNNEESWESEDLRCFKSESEEDWYIFQDLTFTNFFGWGNESWIEQANGYELVYAGWSDSDGSCEFVHIKDGKCIRKFSIYEDEVDEDSGETPELESYVDVIEYYEEFLE